MIGVSTRNSGKRDTLGLLVESVTSGGPAEKAGIEEGDRLVSVNGVNLRLSAADAGEPDMDGVANRRLIRELEKLKAGDEVELRVYRDGNTRTVRVKTVAADELNKEVFASTSGAWSTDEQRSRRPRAFARRQRQSPRHVRHPGGRRGRRRTGGEGGDRRGRSRSRPINGVDLRVATRRCRRLAGEQRAHQPPES